MEEKHTKLKTESARKAETVQKISRGVATRAVIGATRNVTSLPGQAIPYAGAAFVVGVTIWDIHDLCQNMKDINELNNVFELQPENQDEVCGIEVPTKEQVIAEAKKNWQAAYKTAAYQVELSQRNAKDLVTHKYEDAKEQAILMGGDLKEHVETTYWNALNKINEINTGIHIPPLKEIQKTVIDKIYDNW